MHSIGVLRFPVHFPQRLYCSMWTTHSGMFSTHLMYSLIAWTKCQFDFFKFKNLKIISMKTEHVCTFVFTIWMNLNSQIIEYYHYKHKTRLEAKHLDKLIPWHTQCLQIGQIIQFCPLYGLTALLEFCWWPWFHSYGFKEIGVTCLQSQVWAISSIWESRTDKIDRIQSAGFHNASSPDVLTT